LVDFEMRAEGFGGRQAAAVSGHYRFRTEQVYHPAGFAMIGKALPQEPVTQA
jgi:hypothetical protein